MIILCQSHADAITIINQIKNSFQHKIFNFTINEAFGKCYLIIDGNIDVLTDSYIKEVGIQKVFSSMEQDVFFVTDKAVVPDIQIGRRKYYPGDNLVSVIAGPCEIESYDSLLRTALELKKIGVSVFRAMPCKPRTSPYNFQGVGLIGWEYLANIKKELDIPVLAEVFNQEEIDLAKRYGIDMIQIGSRNMQNYDLIKRAAASGIPTVLKKGMWCNNTQLLKAAEYFYVYGKGNVILAERGIQTHEGMTRNTFDISSVKLLKDKTCLPVLADASHGTGVKELVSLVNCAAVMMGADIVEVEVHIDPDSTIKPGDYYQMLQISDYADMLDEMRVIMKTKNKHFDFESD